MPRTEQEVYTEYQALLAQLSELMTATVQRNIPESFKQRIKSEPYISFATPDGVEKFLQEVKKTLKPEAFKPYVQSLKNQLTKGEGITDSNTGLQTLSIGGHYENFFLLSPTLLNDPDFARQCIDRVYHLYKYFGDSVTQDAKLFFSALEANTHTLTDWRETYGGGKLLDSGNPDATDQAPFANKLPNFADPDTTDQATLDEIYQHVISEKITALVLLPFERMSNAMLLTVITKLSIFDAEMDEIRGKALAEIKARNLESKVSYVNFSMADRNLGQPEYVKRMLELPEIMLTNLVSQPKFMNFLNTFIESACQLAHQDTSIDKEKLEKALLTALRTFLTSGKDFYGSGNHQKQQVSKLFPALWKVMSQAIEKSVQQNTQHRAEQARALSLGIAGMLFTDEDEPDQAVN